MGAFVFLTCLSVAKFECKYRVCACIVVVRQLYIVNVLAVIEQMCRALVIKCVYLVLSRPTDVDVVGCLTLLLPNLNANIVFVSAALLWCGALYIVNVLAFIEQMCRVSY